MSAGGLMTAVPLRDVLEQEKKEAQKTQAQPLVTGLAMHVRKAWQQAKDARLQTVEERFYRNMRARRAEYDPEKLAQIRNDTGGTEVYANLTSNKCRAAASWIRDVMMGTAEDRPWSIRPTPVADIPPDMNGEILKEAVEPIKQAAMSGMPMSDLQIQHLLELLRDQARSKIQDEARLAADRMADKMEDQLDEGRFLEALDQFIDDIATFPSAVIKGPIVRKKPELKWVPDGAGKFKPQVTETLKLEWERVSPFNIYPSPAATTVDDGYLIERHRLSRQDLNDLIGVEGYDDASIRMVLDQFGDRGMHEWMAGDVSQASAEGKSTVAVAQNMDGLIDALQYWGSVPGSLLRTWGMTEKDVPNPTDEYHVEVWVIGSYVIKAVLNYDPFHRKPYYKASYEDIPGSWWGNSVADLVRDTQSVVNAAMRSMVNNMAMASGPQVGINIDRLPPGEDITQLTPWKIWQLNSDPMSNGNGQPPVTFFQPNSHVNELMQVFERFSELADEYSGIPRYMAGDATGGAGRTASGLSMLISNAGKSIKQVISNIDMNVMRPVLERLYFHNMQYADDPDLKGDVNVIAHGASALIAKEAAQVRRNEFLAATANPIDMQIVGLTGRAAVLREVAKGLDMDVDQIIPNADLLKAMQAMQALMPPAPPEPGAAPPSGQAIPGGIPTPANPTFNGQQLQNGAPVTDNFQPPAQAG